MPSTLVWLTLGSRSSKTAGNAVDGADAPRTQPGASAVTAAAKQGALAAIKT